MPYILIGILVLFGIAGHDTVEWIHLPIAILAILSCMFGVKKING